MEELPAVEDICCRLCATISSDAISIYNNANSGNELADRINMHLPVKVARDDTLPLVCCIRCVITVTDFHELVLRCLQTDNGFREMKLKNTNHNDSLEDHTYVDINIRSPIDAHCEDSIMHNKKKFYNSDVTILQENLTNNLPTILTKEPNECVLEIKSLPVGDASEFVSQDTWLRPSNADPLSIVSNVKNSAKAEDNIALLQYPCELCNEMCHSEEEFVEHVRVIHKDQYEVLRIWPARAKSSNKKSLSNRTKQDKATLAAAKILVNDKVYYRCRECGKNLCSSYTFLWHMRIHTGERPHVCDLCGKQFRVGQGLLRHLRETHEGIKNFPCDICNRMFSSKRNVEEHRNIHTNDRPYVCDTCGKRFKQKASLFVHNRSHTDVFPFPCTYCAMTFRTGAALLMHVRRHTGEKPFACDVCGRSFRVKYELKRHKLIHSDEKPFECELCHLAFRQKRYLRNHNRVTHGIVTTTKGDEAE